MNIQLSTIGRFLSRYLRPHWLRLSFLLVLLLIVAGLQLLAPRLIAQFMDDAFAGSPLEVLIPMALLFIFLAIMEQALSLLSVYFSTDIAWHATNALRQDLFAHILELDQGFHQEQSAGNMIERVDGDIDQLADFFSTMTVQLLGNGLLVIGILIFFFSQALEIGLIYVVFVIVTMLTMIKIRNISVKYWGASREASAQMYGYIEERAIGTEDIRSRGANEYSLNQLYRRTRALFHTIRLASLRGSMVFSVITALFSISVVLILVIGAFSYAAGLISIGMLYLYYAYIQLLRQPLNQISSQLEYVQRAMASLDRVQSILKRKSLIKDGSITSLAEGALALRFEGVDFAYKAGKPVLSGIDFDLAAGQHLGIVGRTGSGKSTISRLIFRFYDVGAGQIYLGGQPIEDIQLKCLRSRVSLVTQDVQLFHASLRDNLRFFNPAIPDSRLLSALEQLQLGDWFAALPEGLDTVLNAGNESLSAGQAQLVSFARAFLSDPSLVILDEASSRLDPFTERLIEAATVGLLKDRTAVIIAHRLETIRQVDEVLVLEEGRVLERGAYEHLVQDPESRFYSMLQSQTEGAIL